MLDPVTTAKLTVLLAERVMGWRAVPNRFLKGQGEWIPSWRFQPFALIADAFEALKKAADSYTLTSDHGTFTACVCIGPRRASASGSQIPEVISLALAQALGLVEEETK